MFKNLLLLTLFLVLGINFSYAQELRREQIELEKIKRNKANDVNGGLLIIGLGGGALVGSGIAETMQLASQKGPHSMSQMCKPAAKMFGGLGLVLFSRELASVMSKISVMEKQPKDIFDKNNKY